MTFLIISFVAGILTVLAPCVLPLLPVVIGSSASQRSRSTPYIVVISLGVSVFLFTYILKVSTVFIMIPEAVWSSISGIILIIFGLTLVFPTLWEKIPGMARFSARSNITLGSGYQKQSFWGDVIVGASLGPVFSSCSPTYFVILASVLPANFFLGSLYLLAYVLGLTLVLLGVAFLGDKFASKIEGFADPHSKLKRGLGVLFIILGLLIATGVEKQIESNILTSGFFDITKVETSLLQSVDTSKPAGDVDGGVNESTSTEPTTSTNTKGTLQETLKMQSEGKYKEIVDPGGFVNTGDKPIKIGDYVGKKVILLDVMTYSCINCQRTFPYVISWYKMYKDKGLIVIGIHTPEFAFEKDKTNVTEAMKRFGITFPVVLDNNYGTWNAYGNEYWPRKYLIDIHGNLVYDHIGEGEYDVMEMKIRQALSDRAQVLGLSDPFASSTSISLAVSSIKTVSIAANSPETYFGAKRNDYLGNGLPGTVAQVDFVLPKTFDPNRLYLGGTWDIEPEYAIGSVGADVIYNYNAKDVYLVGSSEDPTATADVEVLLDGESIGGMNGDDVDSAGVLHLKESRLYRIVSGHTGTSEKHILELRVKSGKVRLYTFTFG